MVDIESWLKIFSERAEETFPGRIHFIGIQGSYARGEAKDTSDIDVVIIFDTFNADDLKNYKLMLDTLPERGKICGFVAGRDEIMHWDTSDLFQFCHDTVPVKGSLEEILALVDGEAVKRAVKTGACNIYHACVHNYLHERDSDILRGLYKSAAFVIQAAYFMRTGRYITKHSELYGLVTKEERMILQPEASEFEELSMMLFIWSGKMITND